MFTGSLLSPVQVARVGAALERPTADVADALAIAFFLDDREAGRIAYQAKLDTRAALAASLGEDARAQAAEHDLGLTMHGPALAEPEADDLQEAFRTAIALRVLGLSVPDLFVVVHAAFLLSLDLAYDLAEAAGREHPGVVERPLEDVIAQSRGTAR